MRVVDCLEKTTTMIIRWLQRALIPSFHPSNFE
jgi:hypothetical protein